MFEESVKAGTLGKQESDFLKRALELKAVTLKEVMVPRTRMDCLEDGMGLVDMMAVASRTKHSKCLPVYRVSRDNVIGILNTRDLHDLFYAYLRARVQPWCAACCRRSATDPASPAGTPLAAVAVPKPFRLADYVRKAYFVPDTMLASTLLEQMRRSASCRWLWLSTSSVLRSVSSRLEDLLEQLVGEIWDEYDSRRARASNRKMETTWHVPGDLTIFEFNKFFGATLSCRNALCDGCGSCH